MSPPPGFRHFPGALDRATQREIVESLRAIIADAPLYVPRMPRSDRPLSVQMTNCGTLGWISDRHGYRYTAAHPETGVPWPPIPPLLLALWDTLTGYPAPPEACLVNLYGPGAKLGSHVDADEPNRDAPVLSISLGDTGLFHIGGLKRRDPKTRMALVSGDVVVLGGAARSAYHGIDRIEAGSSDLLPEGGRINLTLRRVTSAG